MVPVICYYYNRDCSSRRYCYCYHKRATKLHCDLLNTGLNHMPPQLPVTAPPGGTATVIIKSHQITRSLLLNTGQIILLPLPLLLLHQVALTVIIREPPNYTVTTTEYWSQSFTTTTVTAPPGGTDSVIIREPPNPTVTTTEYWSPCYYYNRDCSSRRYCYCYHKRATQLYCTTTEYWSQSYATTTTVTAPPG